MEISEMTNKFKRENKKIYICKPLTSLPRLLKITIDIVNKIFDSLFLSILIYD